MLTFVYFNNLLSTHSNHFFPFLPGLGDDHNLSPSLSATRPSAAFSYLTSWENLSNLPTQGAPLRHVTNFRPRPPRRHRPGNPPPDVVKRRMLNELYTLKREVTVGT